MPEYFEVQFPSGLKINTIYGYINKRGCHICTSLAHNKDGYTRTSWQGKVTYLHRLIYEIFNSEIPKGYCVRHDCDDTKCCNPKHLRIGTIADNNRDKIIRGRQAKGEKIASSKLNERMVKEILKNASLGIPALAEIYNVSETTIRNVLSRKTWKHVHAENYQPSFPSKLNDRQRAENKPSIHNTIPKSKSILKKGN